jgi:hypothetical protein
MASLTLSESQQTRFAHPSSIGDFASPDALLDYAESLPTVPDEGESIQEYRTGGNENLFRIEKTPFPNPAKGEIEVGQLYYRPTHTVGKIYEIVSEPGEDDTYHADHVICRVHHYIETDSSNRKHISFEHPVSVSQFFREFAPVPKESVQLDMASLAG